MTTLDYQIHLKVYNYSPFILNNPDSPSAMNTDNDTEKDRGYKHKPCSEPIPKDP